MRALQCRLFTRGLPLAVNLYICGRKLAVIIPDRDGTTCTRQAAGAQRHPQPQQKMLPGSGNKDS
jgi:hypothetical protein